MIMTHPYWESIDPVCTIYDLDETKTYYFVVRAFDTNGLESADSNEVILNEGMPNHTCGSFLLFVLNAKSNIANLFYNKNSPTSQFNYAL